MSRAYASGTSVAAERSRAELEKLLVKYQANAFAYAWHGATVMIGFQRQGRNIRIYLPMPNVTDRDLTHTPTGQRRTDANQHKAYEAEIRRRWRALLLIVRAKLEAIESGITSFDDEFLPHIVLPNGQTISQHLQPQIALAYDQHRMPSILPGVVMEESE